MAVHKRTKPETYSSVTNAVIYVPVQLDDKDGDRDDHTPRFLSQLCVCACVGTCLCVLMFWNNNRMFFLLLWSVIPFWITYY